MTAAVGAAAEADLRRDPLAARLPAAYRQELAQAALELGAAAALQYRTRPAAALAAELGVKVLWLEDAPVHAGLALRAEYRSHPPEVRIYRRALAALADRAGLPPGQVEAVALAHELFHHLEPQFPWHELPRHTLWRLGPWRRRVLPLRAREVAAHAFAMAVTGVTWYPAALDH
jgi:hypothetical protein